MSAESTMVDTCYGPVSAEVMARAAQIRLLICDVDGVMSDGVIYMGNNGEELKAFNVRDGYGIRCLLTSDVEVAIITGRKANCWKIAARPWVLRIFTRDNLISFWRGANSWINCH